MAAPKGNQNAKGSKGGSGREPAPFPARSALAREVAKLGATDKDLARCFAVSERTIGAWKTENVDFASALKEGKAVADALVEASLFHRATGYSHKAVKIFADPKTGSEKIIEYVEHYPPDTTACIFWLKNRKTAEWRDRVEKVDATHDVEHAQAIIARVKAAILADLPAADPAAVDRVVQAEFERMEAARVG